MPPYLGDYTEDYATLNFKFNTRDGAGAPITLGGTPAISVYKANGTTESTAGITLTVDFDGRTGLHNVLIDLSSDAFYAVANDYMIVITTGTVDSISVVGTVLAHFSIQNRYNKRDLIDAPNSTALAAIAAALQDLANGVETGVTPRQFQRVALAALAGKANGLGGTTVHYRDQADGKNRITATVDADGNRSVVTLDAS